MFLVDEIPDEPSPDADVNVVEQREAKLKRRNDIIIPSLSDMQKSGKIRGLKKGEANLLTPSVIREVAKRVARRNEEVIPPTGEIDRSFFGFQCHALSNKYVPYPEPQFGDLEPGTNTKAVVPVMVRLVLLLVVLCAPGILSQSSFLLFHCHV